MEVNIKKIQKYLDDLSSNRDDISISIKKYKNSKELINKTQEILNNSINDLQSIKSDKNISDNFNLNENIDKIKDSLELIKDENIEFDKFLELYKEIKYSIIQCSYFVKNYNFTIKQLIQDNDNDFVEISYTI